MKKLLQFKLITIYCIVSFNISAQTKGTLLLISTKNANVEIDGETKGIVEANKPKKYEISSGEHYLSVVATKSKEEQNTILNIESGKQKVLKLEFAEGKNTGTLTAVVATTNNLKPNAQKVAELDISIPGLVSSGTEEDFTPPSYLYAFDKGDKIILNLEMSNRKGTNELTIFTYPDYNTVYSKDGFQDLENIEITVNERSIYVFQLTSNHTFDRQASLKIERIPGTNAKQDFNTEVTYKESYDVVAVHSPQKFYVNSGSNATFKGGKSRVLLPVNLPENTVKWYYEFSASRDEQFVEDVQKSLNLFGELANLIDKSGALTFGVEQLTQPPGANYSDVYVLDHPNSSIFTAKQNYSYFTEGSRENYKSGIVEITGAFYDLTYLGIKNPDRFYGIHIVLEVAAIVKSEDWYMDEEN